MWRALRITVLLVILTIAVGVTWGDRRRTTNWTDTLWVGVFPVNADGQPATARYIDRLSEAQFADIEEFYRREAGGFGVAIPRPVKVELYPPAAEPPPHLDPDGGPLHRAWWSLRMRYYGWRMAGDEVADIRMFVMFHDPRVTAEAPHSVGLQKGLLGVAHGFATDRMGPANNVVIAHEVMHALGASDKYDAATLQPVFPQGYADPESAPRYPQAAAEIMAGRMALSPTESVMAESLADAVVGRETAIEINWMEDDAPP